MFSTSSASESSTALETLKRRNEPFVIHHQTWFPHLKLFSFDVFFHSSARQTVLGKVIHRPAKLDKKLARELKGLADPTQDPYDTVSGKTMCTYDFYEGQGRLDGAFCEFTENDKMEYLEKLREFGVVNIEMEGLKEAFEC